MTKLFIFGLSGKMGKAMCDCASALECTVVGGYDIIPHPTLPTFTNLQDINIDFDCIVDFSRPQTLPQIIELAQKTQKPAVMATTGYTAQQQQTIEALSKKVAVFQSSNMSMGIFVMSKLVETASKLLSNDCDIEIIEKHHNQKVDAPSGTAKILAASVNKGMDGKAHLLYGREGEALRKKDDVCIHTVRGGTIVGEHEVIFCGMDEIITISHSASSRKILANGALKAAKFLQSKSNGLYSMGDLL